MGSDGRADDSSAGRPIPTEETEQKPVALKRSSLATHASGQSGTRLAASGKICVLPKTDYIRPACCRQVLYIQELGLWQYRLWGPNASSAGRGSGRMSTARTSGNSTARSSRR